MNPCRLLTVTIFALLPLTMPVAENNTALKDCPDSPNCVSSLAEDNRHSIEAFRITGEVDTTWQALINMLGREQRTKLVEQLENYLHVEVTSLIFRFVDDVEFLLLPHERLIHVRSASRTGYRDFGVNRKRIEKYREQLFAPTE